MHDAHKPGAAKIAGCAYDFLPVLKHSQADESELHFRRKTIMHANQRRRPSAAAASNVILVEDDDRAGIALRQMKSEGRTHYTSANDHDVSSLGKRRLPVR